MALSNSLCSTIEIRHLWLKCRHINYKLHKRCKPLYCEKLCKQVASLIFLSFFPFFVGERFYYMQSTLNQIFQVMSSSTALKRLFIIFYYYSFPFLLLLFIFIIAEPFCRILFQKELRLPICFMIFALL